MAANPFWIQANRALVSQRMESFDRLFEEQKKDVGRKPKDYRLYESLQEAKQDLAESGASLSAEAEQQTSWKRVSME